MKIFVTGATGFLGLNLIEALRAHHGDGATIFALHRATSDLQYLKRFEVVPVTGDVTDAESVFAAMPEDVDEVHHLAADLSFWRRRDARQRRINVGGTANVVEAALERRAKRFVHVSSIAAYAPQHGDVLVETLHRAPDRHWIGYVATKWLSERLVLEAVGRGLPATVLQPGNVLGPWDVRNWAQLLVRLERGQLPVTLPGGAPWCHAASVAKAAVRAARSGGLGERYLLAGEHASYARIIAAAADLVGAKRPPRLPRPVLLVAGELGQWASLLTGREPLVTPEKAWFASIDFRADCTKAERELGYEEVSAEQMLDDTCRWLRDEGVL